jgi:hypothetical protein
MGDLTIRQGVVGGWRRVHDLQCMDWDVRIVRCLESQADLEMMSYDTVLLQVAGVISEYHVEKFNSIIGCMQMVTY